MLSFEIDPARLRYALNFHFLFLLFFGFLFSGDPWSLDGISGGEVARAERETAK